MRELIFDAVAVGAIAWVYHIVLRDKLLSKWFLFGFNKLSESRTLAGQGIYQIIFNCERCFAGQLALWSYLFRFEYNFVEHVVFIAFSILSVAIITRCIN